MNILLFFVYVPAAIMIIGTIFRATYLRSKKAGIRPYGELVIVDDGNLHVYSMGNGEKRIVLLAGLGIPLPSADFSPLMRKLSKSHTVICIEYFGMGFSSESSKPRTCANHVEEIREALAQAGFSPPYILMPHSASSVYSEYYAAQYPEEVDGIICLDGTSTAFYEKTPKIVKFVLPIAALMQTLGVIPIAAFITTNRKKLLSFGYTQKEINDAIVFSGFSMNKTVIEQMVQSSEHVRQVMDLPFPESVPFLKVIAKETWETSSKQLKMTPQEYQYQHLGRIGSHAAYEILEGNHFLHVHHAEAIAELTDRFLSSA